MPKNAKPLKAKVCRDVPYVLEELVNAAVLNARTDSSSRQTVSDAIQKQESPPLVDVGPLSPKRKIPVYVRSSDRISRRKVQYTHSSQNNQYEVRESRYMHSSKNNQDEMRESRYTHNSQNKRDEVRESRYMHSSKNNQDEMRESRYTHNSQNKRDEVRESRYMHSSENTRDEIKESRYTHTSQNKRDKVRESAYMHSSQTKQAEVRDLRYSLSSQNNRDEVRDLRYTLSSQNNQDKVRDLRYTLHSQNIRYEVKESRSAHSSQNIQVEGRESRYTHSSQSKRDEGRESRYTHSSQNIQVEGRESRYTHSSQSNLDEGRESRYTHSSQNNRDEGRESQSHNHSQKKSSSSLSRREEFELGQRFLPRCWELTDFGRYYEKRPAGHRGFEFTVMSYNVLAQELLEENIRLYEDCRESHLAWQHRWALLLEELRYHKPDILCLQEVNKNHYRTCFSKHLERLGYVGHYCQRTGDRIDGCATFFKTSKFTLDESISVKYKNPDGGTVLDKDNVALILKLCPKSQSVPTGRALCVANTHLLFNPRRGDIKLAQLSVLLAELDKHGFVDGPVYKHHGLIVCGDFNSVPDSPLYTLLVAGDLRYKDLPQGIISGQQEGWRAYNSKLLPDNLLPSKVAITDKCRYVHVENERHKDGGDIAITSTQGSGRLQHSLRLVSSYSHTVSRLSGIQNEASTCHDEPCTVDYIFYNVASGSADWHRDRLVVKDVEEAQLQLIGRFGLISQREFYKQGSIPNDKLGSDHLSIMAKFLLR